MSFLAFMKILESSASRYDKGINFLSLGNMKKIYNKIDPYIQSGDKVLDIGCGTGALTLRAALKEAHVKGIDINAEMLAICTDRISAANVSDRVELLEKGVAELTHEPATSYDVVMSGLCFSELSTDEINFALKEANKLLKKEGYLIIIDEVKPKSIVKRLLHLCIRIPVVIITYILTQTTTKAVKNLPQTIEAHDFTIIKEEYAFLGSLALVVAQKSNE